MTTQGSAATPREKKRRKWIDLSMTESVAQHIVYRNGQYWSALNAANQVHIIKLAAWALEGVRNHLPPEHPFRAELEEELAKADKRHFASTLNTNGEAARWTPAPKAPNPTQGSQ